MFAPFASFEEHLKFSAGREGFLSISGPGQHPPHRHREREFNVITAGRARYLIWDSGTLRRVELSVGTLIWLFPHQDHVMVEKSPDYSAWIGVATDALLAPFVDPQPGASDARELSPGTLTQLTTLLAEVRDIDSAGEFNAGLAWAFVRTWQAFEAGDVLPPTTLHPAVARAVRQLREHPERAWSAEALAAACGLSAPHLAQLFRAQTGLTLTAFRNRERVHRFDTICALHSEKTLLCAALESGFGSYSQLHRSYVAVHGVGPRERQGSGSRSGSTNPARASAENNLSRV